jgi:hypothetical protein
MIMKRCIVAGAAVLAAAASWGQSGPPPEEIVKELGKLAKFIGVYEVDALWDGKRYSGKTVIQPAINGWYTQWQFLVKYEGRERENRWMVTYDQDAKKLRIWRFETGPVLANPEGQILIDGDRLITMWPIKTPTGEDATLRNTFWLDAQKNLVFRSEAVQEGKPAHLISETTAKRRPPEKR